MCDIYAIQCLLHKSPYKSIDSRGNGLTLINTIGIVKNFGGHPKFQNSTEVSNKIYKRILESEEISAAVLRLHWAAKGEGTWNPTAGSGRAAAARGVGESRAPPRPYAGRSGLPLPPCSAGKLGRTIEGIFFFFRTPFEGIDRLKWDVRKNRVFLLFFIKTNLTEIFTWMWLTTRPTDICKDKNSLINFIF